MEKMGFYVKGVFKNLFDKNNKDGDYWKLSGRASKVEFWYNFLFLSIINLIYIFLYSFLYSIGNEIVRIIGLIILGIFVLLSSLILLKIGIRRCHDCNYSTKLYVRFWVVRWVAFILFLILLPNFEVISALGDIIETLIEGEIMQGLEMFLFWIVLIFVGCLESIDSVVCVLLFVLEIIVNIKILKPLLKETVQESNEFGPPTNKYYE